MGAATRSAGAGAAITRAVAGALMMGAVRIGCANEIGEGAAALDGAGVNENAGALTAALTAGASAANGELLATLGAAVIAIEMLRVGPLV